MKSDYGMAVGARLRAVRTQQGLSLHGVEEKSAGHWKAVVIGSYERGDRSVTVQKLAELAEFYGLPVTDMLPGTEQADAADAPEVDELAAEIMREHNPGAMGIVGARPVARTCLRWFNARTVHGD